MRACVGAVAVLALAVTTAQADKYESTQGKFVVTFPSGAKVQTKQQNAGGLTLNMTMAEVDGGGFGVIHADLPDAAKDAPPKAILDGMEKGALASSGGKLLESKDTTFGPNKYPSRDLLFEKDGNKGRARMIIAGTRVYIIMVGGAKDVATSKAGDAFIKSFEINK